MTNSFGAHCLLCLVFVFLLCLQCCHNVWASQAAHQVHLHHLNPQVASCQPPKLATNSLYGRAPEWRNSCPELTKVCIDQGHYVLYDEETIKESPNGEKVPVIYHRDKINWFHRHPDAEPGSDTPAMGVSLKISSPVVRLPSDQEWAQRDQLYFSNCTLPVVLYISMAHDLGEFFPRGPAMLQEMMATHGLLDRSASLVLAYPGNIPMPSFNRVLMQPYSQYRVTSLATFSSRQHAHTPSNSTAEGTHVRCFQRAFVCAVSRTSVPYMYKSARYIHEYYKASLPPPAATTGGPPIFSSAPGTLKVLFEVKGGTRGVREFLNLPEVLHACNSGEMRLPPSLHNGQPVAVKGYECRSHTFGNSLRDIAILRQADVLVAIHGAGGTNALFMRPQSSFVEVRPKDVGTTFASQTNAVWPSICQRNEFQIFCWFMNVDEESHWTPGVWEKANQTSLYPGIADTKKYLMVKDRNVALKPEWVELMLQQVVATGGNTAEFKKRWGASQLAYTFNNGLNATGAHLPGPEGPSTR